MRIREAQKHIEPTDPDSQHWFLDFFIFNLEFSKRSKFFAASYKNPSDLLILRLQYRFRYWIQIQNRIQTYLAIYTKNFTKLYSIVSQKVVISFLI
jgi:hypothetical protein